MWIINDGIVEKPGWWFGTCMIFPYLGKNEIPTDEPGSSTRKLFLISYIERDPGTPGIAVPMAG